MQDGVYSFAMSDEIRYIVRLKPEEVQSRLAGAVGIDLLTFSGMYNGTDKEAIGYVDQTKFRFRMRAPIYQNPFRPYLLGKIESMPEGCRIVVKLGMHPFTQWGMILWLGFAGLLWLLLVLVILTNNFGRGVSPGSNVWFMLLVFTSLVLAAPAMVGLGRFLGRSEKPRLIAFLEQLLGPAVEKTFTPG